MPAPSSLPRVPWWADRSSLLVAAPLVGAAWLPWWALLGFGLALALTRREGDARTVRGPLLLLGGCVGLLPLLPGMFGPEGALAFTRLFLTVLGGVALISLALSELEAGRAGRGAGGLTALLLLGPLLGQVSPVGLALGVLALPLVLLGAPGAEERPHLRPGGGGWAVGRVVGAVLLAAVLVGLLALALPGGGGGEGATRTPPPATAQGRQAVPPTRPQDALPQTRRAAPPPGARVSPPTTGTDLVLLGGVLFLLSLAFAMWRMGGRVRAGRVRFRWWEVAALLGLLLTAALVVALGLAARLGDAGGPLAGAPGGPASSSGGDAAQAQGAPASGPGEGWLWWLSLLVFAVFTGLAGAVFWLALRFRPPTEGDEDEPNGRPDTPPFPDEAATHRVRAAYRAALAALGGVGLGRAGSETPAEHANRAAHALPGLGGPLGLLVAAYAPVRYGGRVTDEDAEAAEEAARQVAELTARSRPTLITKEGETA